MTATKKTSIVEAAQALQTLGMGPRSERFERAVDLVDRLAAKGLLKEERFVMVAPGSEIPVRMKSSACRVRWPS